MLFTFMIVSLTPLYSLFLSFPITAPFKIVIHSIIVNSLCRPVTAVKIKCIVFGLELLLCEEKPPK